MRTSRRKVISENPVKVNRASGSVNETSRRKEND